MCEPKPSQNSESNVSDKNVNKLNSWSGEDLRGHLKSIEFILINYDIDLSIHCVLYEPIGCRNFDERNKVYVKDVLYKIVIQKLDRPENNRIELYKQDGQSWVLVLINNNKCVEKFAPPSRKSLLMFIEKYY